VRAQFAVLDRVGVSTMNVLLYEPAGWNYSGGWSEPNLLSWLELRKQFPERLLVFGTVDFFHQVSGPDSVWDRQRHLQGSQAHR